MIRAIIFDFFGVMRTDAYEAWLKAHGLRKEGVFFEVSRLQDIGEISNTEFCRRLSKLTGINVTQQELNKGGKINFDTIDIVKKLKKRYRIALLSNSSSVVIRKILKDNNLEHYFNEIIISSEVKLTKPSYQIFSLTINKLGVTQSEVIFIDDNEQHIQGAEKAGIRCIQFSSAKQLSQDLKRLGVNL